MKRIKKIIETLKLKWLRDTGLTVLLIVIMIAIFVGINLGIEALELSDIDFTEEQLYTLSDESKEAIAEIPEEDEIEIYMFDYEETDNVVNLVKQYEKVHENLTVTVTTVTDRADLVSEYGVEEGYYDILIISGDKYKLFDYTDFYTYDYNTYDTIDITEQRITNGIIAVSSIGEAVPVYILTGHDEYTTSDYLGSLATYLEVENYEVIELDLLVTGEVPDDCSALIVCSPQTDFTEYEVELITDYINDGGDILWMNDVYSSTDDMPNIQSILDIYGVTVEQDGIVLEQDSSKIVMQSPDIILPTIETQTVAGDLYSSGTVMFLDSGRLSFVSDSDFGELGVVRTDILTTSDESFYRTDLSISSTSATDSDEVGSCVVGALLEKSLEGDSTSKLVIYANNLFATDAGITVSSQTISAINFYNNLDLVLNSVSFVSEREDQITVRKTVSTTYYTATEDQDTLIKIIIFGLPVLIIIIGIVVWQLRRRKK